MALRILASHFSLEQPWQTKGWQLLKAGPKIKPSCCKVLNGTLGCKPQRVKPVADRLYSPTSEHGELSRLSLLLLEHRLQIGASCNGGLGVRLPASAARSTVDAESMSSCSRGDGKERCERWLSALAGRSRQDFGRLNALRAKRFRASPFRRSRDFPGRSTGKGDSELSGIHSLSAGNSMLRLGGRMVRPNMAVA